jgi:hypothetical protein
VELERHLHKFADVRLVVDDEHLGYPVVYWHDVLVMASWGSAS